MDGVIGLILNHVLILVLEVKVDMRIGVIVVGNHKLLLKVQDGQACEIVPVDHIQMVLKIVGQMLIFMERVVVALFLDVAEDVVVVMRMMVVLVEKEILVFKCGELKEHTVILMNIQMEHGYVINDVQVVITI